MKIKDLATIQMGYSFRSGLEADHSGGIAVIQMKDLLDDNTVRCDDLTTVDIEDVKEHHLTQKGDLIFRSRGQVTTTAILLEDPGKAIVAAPLFRIRVNRLNLVMPEYLNWYISQRDAQVFLTSKADGTAQKMINKRVIEDLEVAVPRLEIQQHIVTLAALSAHEQTLLHQLAEKRKQYISTALMQHAKGE